MNEFQNPIRRNDDSRVEHPHAIPPIEKDKKKSQEEPFPSEGWDNEESRSYLIATLFSTIKKLLNDLGDTQSKKIANPSQLKNDLVEFKNRLEELTHTDKSHNTDYLFILSELWHSLLTDFSDIDITEQTTSPVIQKISEFSSELFHYPPGEDHSLGYYLTEHAGKDWMPFPLMKILQNLYLQHQKSPEQSKLSSWLYLLSDIIARLELL